MALCHDHGFVAASPHPRHGVLPRMDFAWSLPAGRQLLTETSAKVHLEGLSEELYRAGLDPTHTWLDPAVDYSVTLATMPAESACR